MSKNSKAYRAAAEKVDHDNLYTPLEAAKLAKETSSTKQDSTVEVAIRLWCRPAQGRPDGPRHGQPATWHR